MHDMCLQQMLIVFNFLTALCGQMVEFGNMLNICCGLPHVPIEHVEDLSILRLSNTDIIIVFSIYNFCQGVS